MVGPFPSLPPLPPPSPLSLTLSYLPTLVFLAATTTTSNSFRVSINPPPLCLLVGVLFPVFATPLFLFWVGFCGRSPHCPFISSRSVLMRVRRDDFRLLFDVHWSTPPRLPHSSFSTCLFFDRQPFYFPLLCRIRISPTSLLPIHTPIPVSYSHPLPWLHSSLLTCSLCAPLPNRRNRLVLDSFLFVQ